MNDSIKNRHASVPLMVHGCIPPQLPANTTLWTLKFSRRRRRKLHRTRESRRKPVRGGIRDGYIGLFRFKGLLIPYAWSEDQGIWVQAHIDTFDMLRPRVISPQRIHVNFNSEHTASSPGTEDL